MSSDLSKITKQIAFKYPTQNTLGDLMSSFKRQERDALKALIGSKDLVPSFVEEFNRQQQQTFRDFHELFSSQSQTALEALFGQHDQEVRRIEQAIGGQLNDAVQAHRQFLQQLSYTIEPVQGILDRIKADYAISAPWLDQMKSAADHTAAFLDSLSGEDSSEEDATDWVELDKQLSEFEAAIQQLPPSNATAEQGRAAGISVSQQLALIISLLSLLFTILAYIEARTQGQVSRQQYATDAAHLARAEEEERAFRNRLIASIDAIAQRIPTPQLQYVVGARPTTVRSSPGYGLILGKIHPNQVVVVNRHEGRWMKVAYRDHLYKRDVEGWVLKHYLVRHELDATATSRGN